jgi:hypothetical protein
MTVSPPMPQALAPEPVLQGSWSAGKDLDAGQVERIVNDALGGGYDGARRLSVLGPCASTAFSQIFRGDGDLFPCPVAIKLFRRQQFDVSPSDAARTYHRALTQLCASAEDHSAFGIVRPFGLIADHGLVIAEWIEGVPLSQWLVRAPHGQARLLVQQAGTWLARLHVASKVASRPMDIGAALERLDETMDVGSGRTRSGSVFRAAYLLHFTAGKLAEDDVLWSHAHGDFKPVNLIVRDGQVFGIDVDFTHMTPTAGDVAHFLNHLRLLCYSLRGQRLAAQIPVLDAAFCEGYVRGGGVELPPQLLAWQRLRNALNLLLRHREWSRPPRSWLASLALLRLVRQLSDELVGAVSTAQALPLVPAPSDSAEPPGQAPGGN